MSNDQDHKELGQIFEEYRLGECDLPLETIIKKYGGNDDAENKGIVKPAAGDVIQFLGRVISAVRRGR